MVYAGPEKRGYKRIKHPFMARIRVIQGTVKPEEFDKWNIVTIRNLSAAGISFNYHKKLAIGTVLEFNITLPISPNPIRCLAKVCRVDESKSDRIKIPIFGVAAHFVEIEGDKKEAINKFVSEST